MMNADGRLIERLAEAMQEEADLRKAAQEGVDQRRRARWARQENRAMDRIINGKPKGPSDAEWEAAEAAVGRIAAALAEMDRSSYGDPEVPFRMRTILKGTS